MTPAFVDVTINSSLRKRPNEGGPTRLEACRAG
jgi:hypothetical protein